MQLLRHALDAKAVFPAGRLLDFFKSLVGGISDLGAANILKPGSGEKVGHCGEIPHPEVGAVAKPRPKQSANASRALFRPQMCSLHKDISSRVCAGEVFKIRENESENLPRLKVVARVTDGSLAIFPRKMLKNVRAINPVTGMNFERQPLDNISVTGVCRKHRMACDKSPERKALYTQSWTGIEIYPVGMSGEAATILNIQRIHCKNIISTKP